MDAVQSLPSGYTPQDVRLDTAAHAHAGISSLSSAAAGEGSRKLQSITAASAAVIPRCASNTIAVPSEQPGDVAVHDRGRDIGLGPGRDLLVVAEAGREHTLQRRSAGQARAHGEKFIARHRAVGGEEILSADLPADAQPLLGEHDGGVFLRPAMSL